MRQYNGTRESAPITLLIKIVFVCCLFFAMARTTDGNRVRRNVHDAHHGRAREAHLERRPHAASVVTRAYIPGVTGVIECVRCIP